MSLTDRDLVLLTETKSLDKLTVAVDVLILEVVEKGTTLTYEHCEAACSLVVLVVLLQMLCKMLDAVGEKGYLTLWRTGVSCGLAVLCEDFCLLC